MYTVKKKFGHDIGLSCTFRQWKATETHCSMIHGYALGITLTIEGVELDHRNWLVSFGDFKQARKALEDWFDHTTILAEDDPLLPEFKALAAKGAMRLRVHEKVGCEAFAQYIYRNLKEYVDLVTKGRASLVEVEVAEHGANSVIYREDF